MSMEYIRETYGVPAKRGTPVEYCEAEHGVIVGAKGAYLRVRFLGERRPRTLHPTYALRYWHGDKWIDPNAQQHNPQLPEKP